MKLFSTNDIAKANNVSTRWVQMLACQFGIGTPMGPGRFLVFTEEEALQFGGEEPSQVTIQMPVHPAIAKVLREMAELEGKGVGQFAANRLLEHLKRSYGNG